MGGADEHAAGSGPRAICGFRDGSLSVADTAFRGTAGQAAAGGGGGGEGVSSCSPVGGGGSGAIPWSSKAGHIETVFSCEHRPGDPDTLATGSYGSSVKVWHVPTMDLKVRSDGMTATRRARWISERVGITLAGALSRFLATKATKTKLDPRP